MTLFAVGALLGWALAKYRHPLCWLETIRLTIRTGVWMHGQTVSGHALVEDTRLNQCVVDISKCERCEAYEFGWHRTARSTYEPHADERSAPPSPTDGVSLKQED